MSGIRMPEGCHECCKRRIKCDGEEPQCRKCRNKGIKCSGQGLRYRFAYTTGQPAVQRAQKPEQQPANRRTRKRIPSPATAAATFLMDTRSLPQGQRVGGRTGDDAAAVSGGGRRRARERWKTPDRTPRHLALSLSPQIAASVEMLLQAESIALSPYNGLSPVYARSHWLFEYFSQAVAPIMVVLDSVSNGYRDIILPLSTVFPIVQQAISAVAMYHMANVCPDMLPVAEKRRMAIVTQLHHESATLVSGQRFSLATWATVLVLLVGETVTGSNDFVYLLEMLKCLERAGLPESFGSDNLPRFLVQQVRMFELFGNPQAHESDGIKVMYNGPDCYFDFINYTLDPDSPALKSIYRIKMAIRISCEIYRRRAESNLPHNESIGLLEQLRLTVLEIDTQVEGSHALVWPYFVAAAESILPSHRDFFSGRLWAIYHKTKFRSITRALSLLDVIWELQGVRRWTEVVENDGPVLVM